MLYAVVRKWLPDVLFVLGDSQCGHELLPELLHLALRRRCMVGVLRGDISGQRRLARCSLLLLEVQFRCVHCGAEYDEAAGVG